MNQIVVSEEIVAAVMRSLRTRKGFNWWYDEIDPDIQAEIESDVEDVVEGILQRRVETYRG